MKNLFKSLMLVAVAAMTFTACEKDNNEANKAEQKTVINGVATIKNDDTRSYFTENNGEGYASTWEGNEQIKVFAGEESVSTTVDSEGNFTATFDGEVNTITVCSPAYQWSDANTFDVPYFQVPLANSVATDAHILKSEETVVSNGTASVQMKHAAAYGKMTLGVPAGFVVYRVMLNINDEVFHEILATNAENNTIWFGVKPIEVSTLTVNAYDIDGNYVTKTVNMAGAVKPLAFVAGQVSTFSVNGLAEKVEEITFTDAEALISGDKLNVTFSNTEHTLMIPFGSAAYDENGKLQNGTWTLTHMGTSDITWDGMLSYSYFCSAMEVVVTDSNVTINFTWNGDKYIAVYEGTVVADLDAKAPLYYVFLYDYAQYPVTSNWDKCYTWDANNLLDINNGLGFVFRNDNSDWYTVTFETNGNYYVTPGTYTLGDGIVSGNYATMSWHNPSKVNATAAEVTVSFENNTYTFDVNIDYGGTVIEGTFTLNLDDYPTLGVTAPAN